MMKKFIFVVMLISAFITMPVSAINVTYPDEYYSLKNLSELYHPGGGTLMQIADNTAISAIELRRQNILMERQNELLAEQNEMLSRLVNATDIRFQCVATGYVVSNRTQNIIAV